MTKILAALCSLCFALAFGTAAQAQTANPNPIGVDPEHYQCYSITNPVGFQQRDVRLKDQFGLKSVTLVAPRLLCAPVSKNGELLADTQSHLVCYVTKGGQTAGKKVQTINQLGSLTFTVNTANLLCVPSLKKVLPQ